MKGLHQIKITNKITIYINIIKIDINNMIQIFKFFYKYYITIMKNLLIIFYTLFWILTWESNIFFSFFLLFLLYICLLFIIISIFMEFYCILSE